MEDDCIVILSGGLDSTVLLYKLIEEGRRPITVTFNYGQRHYKELEMARRTSSLLGLENIVITLPLERIFSASSLLKGGDDIPEGHYTDSNQRSTVVPNRNMILLSFAVGIAEDRGLRDVYYGAHMNDRTTYPDCRPEFIEAVSRAAREGTYNKVRIIAPFGGISKADIVREGARLGVPFENTWSCYKGGESPCGRCGTCVERIEAFELAGIKDGGLEQWKKR
ncbi:MAG TPA: 7-cyano-7-deazaguanine synthase QueC [Candidatus Methanofastidiosa archaeon]|nr:7-cyano-7-deazaguanine synthase QueC [Candidatus Methanofastidiosa archaeon]HPR41912.1 7-cyano-7-deazaguanine synthase QueC [Candidatus Methanofastidiosa archaeon]